MEKAKSQFVVACGNVTVILDALKKSSPEIAFVRNTSRGTVLSDETANGLATVCFIRQNCFALELYAFEKSNSRLDFGAFAAPRRSDCTKGGTTVTSR